MLVRIGILLVEIRGLQAVSALRSQKKSSQTSVTQLSPPCGDVSAQGATPDRAQHRLLYNLELQLGRNPGFHHTEGVAVNQSRLQRTVELPASQ